jgi:hypothetical protein
VLMKVFPDVLMVTRGGEIVEKYWQCSIGEL